MYRCTDTLQSYFLISLTVLLAMLCENNYFLFRLTSRNYKPMRCSGGSLYVLSIRARTFCSHVSHLSLGMLCQNYYLFPVELPEITIQCPVGEEVSMDQVQEHGHFAGIFYNFSHSFSSNVMLKQFFYFPFNLQHLQSNTLQRRKFQWIKYGSTDTMQVYFLIYLTVLLEMLC